MSGINCLLESQKHKCGDYYGQIFPIYEKISSNETIDIGNIRYCKRCDSYTIAASPFWNNKKFNDTESKNFKEMLKFLKDNHLISSLKIEKIVKSQD